MSASITSGTYPRTARRASGTPWLQRTGRSLWQFLLTVGERRAAPHLLQLAMHYDHTNPALAQQLREAARGQLNS